MKKHDTDCAYIQFNDLRITIRGGSNFVDFMDHLRPRINTHDEKRKKGINSLIILVNSGHPAPTPIKI